MGLIRGVARTAAIAGTATAVSNRVSRRQAGRWAAKDQAAAEEAAPPEPEYAQQAPPPAAVAAPAAPPSTGMDDKLGQLKELGALKEAGVLTDAEFEAQKGKILYAS
jgi:hypothetical protein